MVPQWLKLAFGVKRALAVLRNCGCRQAGRTQTQTVLQETALYSGLKAKAQESGNSGDNSELGRRQGTRETTGNTAHAGLTTTANHNDSTRNKGKTRA